MQASNPQTPSYLDSPPNTSTPACVSLSFNGSNWIDHQGVENFFSLKTLSLCERKLLKDLTRDSHKSQYEQPKNVARVCLLYLGQIRNPKRFNNIGLSWKFTEENVRLDFRLIKPKLRSIEKG